MALYPIEQPEISEFKRYTVQSGSCAVFSITIDEEDSKKIFLMHTDATQQDYSLRAWVTTEIGGQEFLEFPLGVRMWPVGRTPHHIVAIHDKNVEAPDDILYRLPVEPGTYYVHILNLTNKRNSFSYFVDPSV